MGLLVLIGLVLALFQEGAHALLLVGSLEAATEQKEGMGAFLEKRKHEPYQNK